MARFSLLTLLGDEWNGKQMLSEQWVKWALTPTKRNPGYAFTNWYLNTGRKLLPDVSENVFCHVGNGATVIYVDPKLDLVSAVRWIDFEDLNGFVARVRAAVK